MSQQDFKNISLCLTLTQCLNMSACKASQIIAVDFNDISHVLSSTKKVLHITLQYFSSLYIGSLYLKCRCLAISEWLRTKINFSLASVSTGKNTLVFWLNFPSIPRTETKHREAAFNSYATLIWQDFQEDYKYDMCVHHYGVVL